MPNPFDQLDSINPADENNPFNSLSGKNLTGYVPPPVPQTQFAKVQGYKVEDAKLKKQMQDANSFWGLAKETFSPSSLFDATKKVNEAFKPSNLFDTVYKASESPIVQAFKISNLAPAAWDIAKTTVTHPIETANQAALGFANGVTLGATDYLQRKAFTDEAKKGGFTDEEIKSMADNMLKPEDPTLQGIRGGANIASYVVPYAGIEKGLINGLKYAAPAFVANYSRAAKLLVDIGAFNAAGQIEETFKGSSGEERLNRAALDTATAGIFSVGGNIYRSIRGTPFKSPFATNNVGNPNSLVPQDAVVSENTLKEGAQARIKELSGKAFLRGDEPAQLKFLKQNLDNPDALFAFNSATPAGIGAVAGKYKPVMTEEEATAFTKDSKLPQTFKHGADPETAKLIKEGGFRGSKDFPGNGMVSLTESTDDAAHYANLSGKPGEVLPVRVNAQKVKVYSSMDEYTKALESSYGKTAGAKEVNLNAPYDAVVIKNSSGGTDAVFAKADRVVVVSPKSALPVQDAKVAMTIEVPSSKVVGKATEAGAVDGAKAVDTGTTKITVATNDMDALQSYIKGSNDIDYKIVDTLGKDAKGNPIQARFEAKGGTNGRPIIYATDATTASNLGHELGHYFDNKLTATVDGKLSSILPDFEKNRPMVEDTLGSLAIKNLGGEATSEKISAEISRIASSLKTEIDILSSNRRGALIPSKSERFADAVSEVLTKEGASAQAPTLTALLKHSEVVDTAKLFGESVAKELKSVKMRIPDNVVTVEGKTFELAGEAKARYQTAKQSSDAHIESIKSVTRPDQQGALLKGEGMRMSALKRELTGQYTATELANLVKKEQANYVGKNVEVTINGKKVNAEIATRSAFGNTKVKLANGDVISVKNSAISPDSRPMGDIIKKLTERSDVKAYEPSVIKQVLEEPKPKAEAPVKEKVVEKAPDLGRTDTGKKPDTAAIRAEKITTDAETETFINNKILPKLKGTERVGKTNADIIERSYSSDLTQDGFDNILKERFGNLSEDIVKAKRILTDGASNLKDSLAGRSMADLSGEEAKTLMSDYSRLVQTFEVFSGVRTELSNSFRSLGLGVAPGENDVLRNALETIQKAIGAEKDPFQIMKKIVSAQEKGPVAKYFEVWYPALLSGPKTSVRNILGNASNLTIQTLSKLFTKEGRSEFMPTVNAIIGGQKEALNKAMSVLKGESSITSKIVEGEALTAKTFKGKLAFLNNLEYVGRFLNAQDAYFSSIAKEGEIAAIRKGAVTYGLKDKALIDVLNENVGQAYAQNATFRNQFEKTFVGEIGSKVTALKNSENQAVKSFANFFTPFVKTVANITDRRIDFVPIFNLARTFGARGLYEQRASRILADTGLFAKMMEQGATEKLSGSALKEFAQGETDRVKEIIIDRLRNQQLGRFYMGTAVMAAGIPLAVAGRITGSGPSNKAERDTLMASGWRPNSIIMPNGVALPYQNLALPLSSILSVLGNVSDGIKYKTDKSTLSDATLNGFKGYIKSELDQSFLSGMANLYDGLSGYKPFSQVVSEMAVNAIPVPAAWSQTKDILFPERYNAKGFNEVLRNKLGITGDFFGLATPLQPNVNAFGEQVKADLIYGITPPLLNSKRDDPVLNFMLDNGISVGKPQIATKIEGRRGEKRQLTEEEYTAYATNSGSKVYDTLKSRIESGYFDRYKTAEDKKSAMDKIVTQIRNEEKRKIKY